MAPKPREGVPDKPKAPRKPRPKPFSKVGGPTKTQENSALLRLPAEIRNQIYELVFTDGRHLIPERAKRTHWGRSQVPGLLLACKQTHMEAIQLFYYRTAFVFGWGTEGRFEKWIKKMGPARAALLKNVILSPSPQLSYYHSVNSFRTHGINHDAQAVQDRLDRARRDIALPLGVLQGSVKFLGYEVVTSSPEKHIGQVLELCSWALRVGWYWKIEPSEELRKLFHFIPMT